MADKIQVTNNGIGFGSLLFLLFLGLKLTGYIDWSWWWVTAPLWIPFSLAILFLTLIGIVGLAMAMKD